MTSLCNCGRDGLPAMFHPESCPGYGGFRPAVFDGWHQKLAKEEPQKALICCKCGKVWGVNDVINAACTDCGGYECASQA